MTEKLTIRNFGPIVDVDLILCPVTVLIGDQGTGKSTIAKLLFCLKGAAHNFMPSARFSLAVRGDELSTNEKRRKQKDNFINDFLELLKQGNLLNCLSKETFIDYRCATFSMTYSHNETSGQATEETQDKSADNIYFIPAAREAFIIIKESYPALMVAKADIPIWINLFGQHFNNYRAKSNLFDYKNILNFSYQSRSGKDILISDGKEFSFQEASSAINSSLPMLVTFDGVINEMKQNRGISEMNRPFIVIEEPELNCFPKTQKDIVDYLVTRSQTRNNFLVNLLITTHSPYILSALNNLMSGFEAASIDSKQVEKLYPGKTWLNPKDVSVYLLKDGLIEDIMDHEQHLIKVDKIDAVSDILNEEFESFLKIQL